MTEASVLVEKNTKATNSRQPMLIFVKEKR